MLLIFLLGFSSGLPCSIVGGLFSAWFKTSGLSIVSIGFLGLIAQPYVYKFLWAPLLDRFEPPFFKWLDHRRAWILISQLCIILIILSMMFLDPKNHAVLIGFLGLLLAFGSATQDIVIDAYRINILEPDERGLGAALAVEGYRVSMIVAGSFGLILADYFGWPITYLVMAGFMLVGVLAVITIAPTVAIVKPTNLNWHQIIWEPLGNFLKKDKAILILLLISMYKIGDVCSHALTTPFLLDLNFSLTAVGTINKLVSTAASLIGIMLAGLVMTKVNLFRSLLFFGCLQGISNLLYMLLALVGKNYYIAIIAFFIENLCSGMGNAALVALIMSMCSKEFSGTQYALLSSLTAIGRVYFGPIAGLLVHSVGWSSYYFISACLAIPGILLILLLRQQIIINENRSKAIAF